MNIIDEELKNLDKLHNIGAINDQEYNDAQKNIRKNENIKRQTTIKEYHKQKRQDFFMALYSSSIIISFVLSILITFGIKTNWKIWPFTKIPQNTNYYEIKIIIFPVAITIFLIYSLRLFSLLLFSRKIRYYAQNVIIVALVIAMPITPMIILNFSMTKIFINLIIALILTASVVYFFCFKNRIKRL